MMFRLHSRLVLWNLLIIGLVVSLLAYFVGGAVRRHMISEIQERLLQETSVAALYLSSNADGTTLDDRCGQTGRAVESARDRHRS